MQNTLNRVIDCIAVTTRYPREVLLPEADLENDLGIDSVKRVEIVAALADEFNLDLANKQRDPTIRTIEQVASWIEREVGTSPPPTNEHRPAVSSPHNDRSSSSSAPPASDQRPVGDRHREVTRVDASDQTRQYSQPHATAAAPRTTESQPRVATPAAGALAGRVALVTGSGRGVGRTITRVLAARGATVIVNSFHSRDLGEHAASEINATGGTAVHLWGSVANPQQVDTIFDQIEQQFGYLDILVCNASDGRLGSFTEITREDWERAFHTNVTGHYECAMRASRLMQPRGGGSIITMSSIGAMRYVQGLGGQGVVKAAVESMTRYLACELAEYGIRANCISGGPVYGDVMEQLPDARATFNYWESIVPDRELCSPIDLANTVAYLVSDEARGINGAIWTVDHGASTRAHSRQLPQFATTPAAAPHVSN